jgi:hypothetical protein
VWALAVLPSGGRGLHVQKEGNSNTKIIYDKYCWITYLYGSTNFKRWKI